MTRSLRIALVYDALFPHVTGGAERRYDELARRLAERHEVHRVSWQYWDGPSRRTVDGITYHGVGRAPQLYGGDGKRTVREAAAFAARVLPVLLRNRWDVIDCAATPYLPLTTAALAARLTGTPLVATWHEFWGEHWASYLPHRPLAARAAREIESRSRGLGDRVVAVSPFTARQVQSRRADEVAVVGNGVDLDAIAAAPPARQASDVVFVGRLIDEKRVDLLVDAMALLRAQHPDARCLIVGDGPERQALEAQVERLKLGRNITLLGRVDGDVSGLLKAARVLVLPSAREGYGIVVAEAQACGAVPVVVSSPMSAAPDLVRDGVDGLVCQPRAEEIAAAVSFLLDDDTRREEMARAGRATAGERGWDRVADEMERVYAALVAARAPAVALA